MDGRTINLPQKRRLIREILRDKPCSIAELGKVAAEFAARHHHPRVRSVALLQVVVKAFEGLAFNLEVIIRHEPPLACGS